MIKNLPHKAEIQLGPEVLELDISAMYDMQGDYIGPMVAWTKVTEKKKLQEESARKDSMIENSPSNIMLADMNFNIVYMNPATKRSLQPVESHLPKPINQMIGESVCSFHRSQ